LNVYRVLVEGSDKGRSFLFTVEVAAQSPEEAINVVRFRARDEGWMYVNTEEFEHIAQLECKEPVVLARTGRAYFGA
jgi:hypothetical protein